MQKVEFRGFAGLTLTGEVRGHAEDPLVVLLTERGDTSGIWDDLAGSLVGAGRQVLLLEKRGAAAAAAPGVAAEVEDLRAVLGQLPSRPVVVAGASDGWIALQALTEDAAQLVTGLVLVKLPGDGQDGAGKDALGLPGERLAVPVVCLAPEDSGGDVSETLSAMLVDFLEAQVPRAAPQFRQGSDARTLRDALGCFATGVTVVTAVGEDGEPVGLTANSFTSVSLDPPLLLVCIAKSGSSAEVLATAPHFAVNVLHIGQQPASARFATRNENRFGATPWSPGLNGVPVLTSSLATFECARDAVHEGGDHLILVGRVERAQFEPRRDPLLYFRGKYRRLHFA
ncbi:MAG: flavin reductase [Hyphomonas sp.]|jgi:flavin reductase (DIM6/NTAB) family NADH-FMN oxidoreductase RutF